MAYSIQTLQSDDMFKHLRLTSYFKYSIPAALCYCIPATIFVYLSRFTAAWLLYLGNFLFLCVIMTAIFQLNKKKRENAGAISLILSGHIATVIGILFSCAFMLLIMMIIIPGFFHPDYAHKVLLNAPANMVSDNTNGLRFMVIANAVFANMSVGSFTSIIFSVSAKGDQTKESAPVKQEEV